MSDRAPSKAQRWHPVPKSWLAAQARERDFLRKEFGQVRDLIPTLMKHRNGSQWSPEERQLLMIQFRSLAHLSPYLVVLVLPVHLWPCPHWPGGWIVGVRTVR